jgi:hypothetical protein
MGRRGPAQAVVCGEPVWAGAGVGAGGSRERALAGPLDAGAPVTLTDTTPRVIIPNSGHAVRGQCGCRISYRIINNLT